MGFWNRRRTMLAAIAMAAVAGACGGGTEDGDGITTTSPPTTTTTVPVTTSAAAPTTTVAATTTTTTALDTTTTTTTTTTVPEELPESIGTSNDPAVATVPAGASRIFYAGEDAAGSIRENVLGDMQVLYYDTYAPTGDPNGLTVLYIHSGAIDAGYANSNEAGAACRQMSALGAWCVAIEYRRGWAGFDQTPTEAVPISASQAQRFRRAYTDARNDALEAWFHLNGIAGEIGLPQRYVLVGIEAGAQIASDLALATDGLPYEIAGAVISSGTHPIARGLGEVPGFPVVLQTGLFDSVAPAYTGPYYLDPDMPELFGARPLYDKLASAGATVRLYVNAQQGHGPGVYARASGEISYYPEAMQLILAPPGEPSAGFEYRFTCSDANFGAAGPGTLISSAQSEEFRYEPYETDMEGGLTPLESLELHPPELSECEA
jgi:acetyl esterase/lipase